MKILIYSDNEWVIESIEKYIDFEYDLIKNIDFEDLNEHLKKYLRFQRYLIGRSQLQQKLK